MRTHRDATESDDRYSTYSAGAPAHSAMILLLHPSAQCIAAGMARAVMRSREGMCCDREQVPARAVSHVRG